MDEKSAGKLRKFIRKRWPILFVGTLLFLASLPLLLSHFEPDASGERIGPYWIGFLIHDLFYLYPVLAVVFVGVLIIYMSYRLRKHDPNKVPFSFRNMMRLQNIILVVLLIPLVFLLAMDILFLALSVRPLHLDSISYVQHQFHVVLDISPFDDWGTFILYECKDSLNLRCQRRYRHDVYYRHRTVLASGEASLVIDGETNTLSMCLFDGISTHFVLDPLAPREDEPLRNNARCDFLYGGNRNQTD